MLECNNDPSQPTVLVAGIEQAPVGCTNPLLKIVSTSASGAVPATNFTVATGTVGPPSAGTDSAGNSAATDAALYPCPPTAAQITAGDSCVIAYGTQGGTQVQQPISFSGGGSTTTTTTAGGGSTTTTSSSTTSTTASTTTTTAAGATTTTTVPCNAQPATVTGPPSVTVNPGTCLNGGTVVTVTGSGFTPAALGNILECNSDTGQPTVALPAPVSQSVPVSCTGVSTAAGALITVGADGTFTASFTIIAGTAGPPCGAAYLISTCPTADSSGGNPTTDAATYPCPPTAAQQAAGDTCTLSFGDSSSTDPSVTVPIAFVPAPTPGSGTTTTTAAGGTTTTTNAATAAATKAATSASTLAFTGAGPDTWYTLLGGLLLLDLGFLILTLYYRPREMVQMLSRGVHKTFGGK